MHDRRNIILTVILGVAVVWGLIVWVGVDYIPENVWPSLLAHRIASVALTLVVGAYLFYGVYIEDKLPDELGRITAGRYFEQEGLCFMPLVRVKERDGHKRAEISLYYQNRFSGEVEVVIHLRPEDTAFHSHKGAADTHFTFRALGGDFGVIHQPVGVQPKYQGECVRVKVAAAVRYIHGHGEELRSHQGDPCGTFLIDWALAYRQSRHELCGEIELIEPATVTLAMPRGVVPAQTRAEYTNELLSRVAS